MREKITDKETLGYLGDDAQYSIVKSLIEDQALFKRVAGLLNPAAFTVKPLRDIVGIMKSHYEEKGICLAYRDLSYILKDKSADDKEYGDYRAAVSRIAAPETGNGQAVATETGVRHLKALEMKRVLHNAGLSLKSGGYSTDLASRVIDQVQAIESANDDAGGMDGLEAFDVMLASTSMERVPSGIASLDERMKGGLPKGNLGLMIAGTGVGKTTFGSIMAIRSALAGRTVVHMFFEDSEADIMSKYCAHLTGRWTVEYENTPEGTPKRDQLEKEIKGRPEFRDALKRLVVRRMRNGRDSVDDVVNFVRRLKARGLVPDMLILDYMSCLKLTSDKALRANKEFELLEQAMKRLEDFAHEENLAIWVMQQTNREATRTESAYDRMGTVQGSFRMTQPAAFVLYLERSRVDKTNHANLYMDKCRKCEPFEWLEFYLNNGNCQMDEEMVGTGALGNPKGACAERPFDPDRAFAEEMNDVTPQGYRPKRDWTVDGTSCSLSF